MDGVEVDLLDDVTFRDAALVSRTVFLDRSHIDPIDIVQASPGGHLRIDVRDADAQHRALHGAELDEIVHHLADDVDRDREGIPRIRAGPGNDGGVDTDQFTGCIDQRAAAVARVHGCIRLDERFDPVLPVVVRHRTALGTDDTGRDSRAQVIRTADSQYPFTEAQVIGIADRNDRKILSINLDQGDVRGRVGSHESGRINLVVFQGDLDDIGAGDHMVVGHDIAVGADDDTGAQTDLVTRRLGEAEEQV